MEHEWGCGAETTVMDNRMISSVPYPSDSGPSGGL